MKLHYISHSRRNPKITASMKKACLDRSVEFIHVDPSAFDFTDKSKLPSPGDLLYRASRISANNSLARTVERWLLQDKIATLYRSYKQSLMQSPASYVIHQKNNLPIPKTIWNVPRNRKLISKYVEYVGGFPVIIKATGGSHGVGVMKIDSLSSLYSIIDYLHAIGVVVILRQFINTRTSVRHVILDNNVLASVEYTVPNDDFRSNVQKKPIVKEKLFPNSINNLAIKAVSTTNYLFGGVDILIDEKDNAYIAEMNSPCNFSRAAEITDTDIAGKILDYLIKKAQQHD